MTKKLITRSQYEELRHHGILGMRWGVRRQRGADGRRTGPAMTTEAYMRRKKINERNLVASSVAKNGDKVDLVIDRTPPIRAFLNRIAPGLVNDDDIHFSHIVNGERAGTLSMTQINSETGNAHIEWIGIKKKHQGKGYGQAAMQNAIIYCLNNGARTMSLDNCAGERGARVYGNSGFEVAKPRSVGMSPDDVLMEFRVKNLR